MNQEIVHRINDLNHEFYRMNHESFNRSRQTAWPGWQRISTLLSETNQNGILRVLDVACGNMRFERHLTESLPDTEIHAVCVDSCDYLAEPHDSCVYAHDDIIATLSLDDALPHPWGDVFDLVVSFGFFHHIPSASLRERLLDMLVASAAPEGLIALSLWRFATDDKMREKAMRSTASAIAEISLPDELENGDYILGWNEVPGAYRYCHSFDDAEIDALVSSATDKAFLVDRFRADGRTGALNEYLVLRRR